MSYNISTLYVFMDKLYALLAVFGQFSVNTSKIYVRFEGIIILKLQHCVGFFENCAKPTMRSTLKKWLRFKFVTIIFMPVKHFGSSSSENLSRNYVFNYKLIPTIRYVIILIIRKTKIASPLSFLCKYENVLIIIHPYKNIIRKSCIVKFE